MIAFLIQVAVLLFLWKVVLPYVVKRQVHSEHQYKEKLKLSSQSIPAVSLPQKKSA